MQSFLSVFYLEYLYYSVMFLVAQILAQASDEARVIEMNLLNLPKRIS